MFWKVRRRKRALRLHTWRSGMRFQQNKRGFLGPQRWVAARRPLSVKPVERIPTRCGSPHCSAIRLGGL